MWYDSLIRLSIQVNQVNFENMFAKAIMPRDIRQEGEVMCGARKEAILWDLIYVITLFVTAIRTNYALKMYRWLKQFIATTRTC